ncbi:MAG: metallophosphoesterase [Eubacteriales bacterium]|nr:metallophosphoesterase [Eubacteriales bacterium]
MSNRAKATIGSLVIILFLAWNWLYFFCQPEAVAVDIARDDIPTQLSGMKIVQISDYHDGSWLWDADTLLESVEEFAPDVIFLTGDMIEGRIWKGSTFFDIAHKLTSIAPVYAVLGNHEHYLSDEALDELRGQIRDAGIILLENDSQLFSYHGVDCRIIGVDDALHDIKAGKRADRWANSDLLGLTAAREDITQAAEDAQDEDAYRILLSHEPYYPQAWAEQDVKIAFCGHLHGGIVRVGDHGLLNMIKRNSNFPEADAGLYQRQGVSVYISRGLSLSYFQPRVANPPEISMIQLVRSVS